MKVRELVRILEQIRGSDSIFTSKVDERPCASRRSLRSFLSAAVILRVPEEGP